MQCSNDECYSLNADVGNGEVVTVHCKVAPNPKAGAWWRDSYMGRIFTVQVIFPCLSTERNALVTQEWHYKPKLWWKFLNRVPHKVAIMVHLHRLQTLNAF